jgi:hypothetical protein
MRRSTPKKLKKSAAKTKKIENRNHKEAFNQLLSDAVLGVKASDKT